MLRVLAQREYTRVVSEAESRPDLHDAGQVDAFFARTAPKYVLLAGGKSGGIGANQKYPVELMVDNLIIACHVMGSAFRHGVTKLLYLASSCVYPRHCAQPMRVEAVLSGPLEGTSEAYAIAKIAGIKLCQAYRREYGVDFIIGIAADIFGPGDDFSLEDSHVLAALLRRIHEAKVRGAETVEIWGTGTPRRDFLFADDLADACLFVLGEYSDAQPINLGGGADLSIGELAGLVKHVVGYTGHLRFDTSKPDGMPLKCLDWSTLRSMGWRPKTPFRAALIRTYEWFLEEERKGAGATSHAG